MKTCSYCGRENEDDAPHCRECGTEIVVARVPGEQTSADAMPEERLERVGVLDNEVQAGLVDAILVDRGVPHIMQTYHDSAYDGIFQTQKGWGVILAPLAFREQILTVLEEIKRQSQA